MTINQIVEKILVALDEISSANLLGNQAEYIDKIIPLIDSVQLEIATIIKKIKKYSEAVSVSKKIDVPADCFEFLKVYDTDMKPLHYGIYNGKIYLLDEEVTDGTFTLYYNKYPEKITASTLKTSELEISKECQEALVFGVCASLTINDEPELNNTYTDKYNVMLSNIQSTMNSVARLVGGIRI